VQIVTVAVRIGCFCLLASLVAIGLPARATSAAEPAPPLSLHPENPHYFLFRGKPTVLVTSTEHYGAVLNADFDNVRYLDELKAKGLNLTRTFSGVYCEDAKSFNIKNNTLAPARDKLVCPWARSATPGYANGGNKFDLTKWDEAYFRRLKDFVAQADKRGIVVELALFCPFYENAMWNLSPMNARNNVNDLGQMPRTEVYTLKHPAMLALHEAVTRKICAELKDFDNLYYEVCNEPYFGGVSGPWQDRIIAAITSAEAEFPHRHLIARNIANGKQKVAQANPEVSIFNFHYATPPHTVALNAGLNRVIADDETGFKGSGDFVYRAEGWDFLLAGGAVYDNLDYSFSVGHEDGSGTVRPDAPGGGGAALRGQLRILKEFIESFDFLRMKPDNAVVLGELSPKTTARALVEAGKQYAVYVRGGGLRRLTLDLPAGEYRFQWTDTRSGPAGQAAAFHHSGGLHAFAVPAYTEDIALGVRR
jgi:hypothetical protein